MESQLRSIRYVLKDLTKNCLLIVHLIPSFQDWTLKTFAHLYIPKMFIQRILSLTYQADYDLLGGIKNN